MNIQIKDGDNVFWGKDQVIVMHADGTQTIHYKSKLRAIWERLKSTIQRFRSRKSVTTNGEISKPNSSPLKVVR
jgi:hypothetical protein